MKASWACFLFHMDKMKRSTHNALKTVAIIPAAGAGIRMGGDRPKQFLDFNGRPLLAVTLEKFQNCPVIDAIIVVAPSDQVDVCQKEIISP